MTNFYFLKDMLRLQLPVLLFVAIFTAKTG